jgi:hypothetical protein
MGDDMDDVNLVVTADGWVVVGLNNTGLKGALEDG